MRWHGASRRRGSSWPTSTSTRLTPAGARASLAAPARGPVVRVPLPGRWPLAMRRRRRARLRHAVRAPTGRTPRGHRRGRGATERRQDDRLHAATLEAGGLREGVELAGNAPLCSRLCSRESLTTIRTSPEGSDRLPAQRPRGVACSTDSPTTLDFQAQALSLRSERQRLIASNIANADTPGYVARDMDFAQALRQATGSLASRPARWRVSQPGHLGGASGVGGARATAA